jgi:hypothetical protein
VLTVQTSAVADADGLGTFSYQWIRDGILISSETDSSYLLTDADVGNFISVKVSYTDAKGTAESVTSHETSKISSSDAILTDANGIVHASVDAAITSNDQAVVIASFRDAAADLGVLGTSTMTRAEVINAIKTSNDALISSSVDITVDNAAVAAAATAAAFVAALTDTEGTTHTSVDAAITSNDAAVLAAAKETLTESIGAISVLNSGTIAVPVLDFYLDKTKDPGDAGVTSVDVTLKFDPTDASFTSFSYANGFLGAANEASAAEGTITFGAIALSGVSTDKPLFTMTMKDLDSSADFAVTVSDLSIDGSSLEGSTLLVGAPASHTVTTTVVTRDGSKISDADVVMNDGTNSSSYTSGSDGSVSGSLTSGSASIVTASLAYSSSTKAISSQDALDALKLSVGMTTAAGTKNAFDFMSADFNQDGKVSSQDALSILKYSVGLPTDEKAKWIFVDTNGDYSDVSKSNTSYTEGVSIAELTADTSVSLTGILIGDVNDSYSGLIA